MPQAKQPTGYGNSLTQQPTGFFKTLKAGNCPGHGQDHQKTQNVVSNTSAQAINLGPPPQLQDIQKETPRPSSNHQ